MVNLILFQLQACSLQHFFRKIKEQTLAKNWGGGAGGALGLCALS